MDMKLKITGGEAIIDRNDYPLVCGFTWCTSNSGHVIAYRSGREYVFMHRLIMNPKGCDQVDHINRIPWDNRRSNLRLCTRQQNHMNRGPPKNNTSGFKGVSLIRSRTRNPWMASIRLNNKGRNLGYFSTKEAAAVAYDDAARTLFGEFAWLNFHGGSG